ncbi:cytochrome P450 [Tribonema minus]|uniref:Cytochrome P450 n=1 Tax=Tribonema minus TaxID=303371 RepID=A0A836CMQ5_9STRA|nr:cytochrome P450 [Tribonema minus]
MHLFPARASNSARGSRWIRAAAAVGDRAAWFSDLHVDSASALVVFLQQAAAADDGGDDDDDDDDIILRRITAGKLPPKISPLIDLPLPIIGPLLNFIMTLRNFKKIEQTEQFGEVMRIPFLFSTAITVVSLEGLKIGLSCKSQGKKVLGTQQAESINALWGRKSLSNISGSEHSRVKKLLHPTVSVKIVANYVSRMESASEDWLRDVVEPALGKPTKMYEPVRRFMMEMPLRLVLGLGDAAPEVGIIADRRAQGCDNLSDTLSEMIKQGQLTDEEMEDQMVTIMLAGYETTAAVMCVAMHVLPMHPEVLEKLRKEQEGIDGPVDWAKFESMTYMLNFVKECLRHHGPVLSFFRTVTDAFEVGGYKVPQGYIYQYHLAAVQRNSVEQPEKIIPERYEDPSNPLNQPFGFTPFGGGEYLCLGERFAKMEICVFLRALVMRYNWTHAAEDPRMMYAPLFLHFTDDLPLIFTRL